MLEKRKGYLRFKISRKSIFDKCKKCNERYNIVKVYYINKAGKEYRADNQHVCFNCGWEESPSDYDMCLC